MTRIFLTHNRAALRHYFGDHAYGLIASLGEVSFNDSDAETTPADIIRLAPNCEILLSFRVPPIDARLMQALPRLTAICRGAVDIRNIDVDHASREGILVTRATPGFGASVAEWIIGVMISLARHIDAASQTYRNGGVPEARMGRELRNATLGIIGYGTIGRYLAGLAQGLGMNLVIHDPYADVPTQRGLRPGSLDTVLETSDFVVCLAPANAETAHLIDLARFRQMRSSAYFINASRAELVNEADLLRALDDGLIAGCALDVGSARDQMPPAILAAHPRVIATPHIGGLTPEAAEHQAMDSVRQVQALLAGHVPPCSVNAQHATRARDRYGLQLPS